MECSRRAGKAKRARQTNHAGTALRAFARPTKQSAHGTRRILRFSSPIVGEGKKEGVREKVCALKLRKRGEVERAARSAKFTPTSPYAARELCGRRRQADPPAPRTAPRPPLY